MQDDTRESSTWVMTAIATGSQMPAISTALTYLQVLEDFPSRDAPGSPPQQRSPPLLLTLISPLVQGGLCVVCQIEHLPTPTSPTASKSRCIYLFQNQVVKLLVLDFEQQIPL